MNIFRPDSSLLFADVLQSDSLSLWLNHQYSLTDKLKEITGVVDIEIISQDWIRATWWDSFVLHLQEEPIYQREILMKSRGVHYWYARTVIPNTCYLLNTQFFSRLEKESIRNLIFNNPQVQFVNRTIYPVDRHCIEYYWVKKHIGNFDGILWIRLTQFLFIRLKPFYLVEILLPALEELTC